MANFEDVDPHSLRALLLWPSTETGRPLATATGFVVRHDDAPFLVTNLHVVTGRNVQTGEQLSDIQCPSRLRICHHLTERLRAGHGAWSLREEPLFSDEFQPLWFEHPQKDLRKFHDPESWYECVVDVAALPITDDANVELYPISLPDTERDVLVRPGLPVHIVGYPLGITHAGLFPIWKTGNVASDFAQSVHERLFLIDASTRDGMSGSPVIFRPLGPYLTRAGEVRMGNGDLSFFLGIYSGRLHANSDIGIVWRSSVVKEVLERARTYGRHRQSDGLSDSQG